MSYTKSTILPIGPDDAFALLTEPERLRRWQTVTARVDLRAGGAYRWQVTPTHAAAGTFREVEPGKRIVFGWGWLEGDDLPADASTVTVTFEPAEGGTRVTLVHDGLTPEQAIGHAEGWTHYFERLEAAAAGDVRQDEWAAAPDPMTPISAAYACLAVIQPVLRALTSEDKPKATPCADFTCHQLAEHLMGTLTFLGALAGLELTPVDGSLESKISGLAGEGLEAWASIDLDSMVSGPNGDLPAIVGAGIYSLELLLHAWDFAQATGQKVVVADELVAYVDGLAQQIIPGARANGSFQEPVEAPADATPLERLAAFSGRAVLVGA